MHFPFHGPAPFLRRVRTFSEGPKDKVWQMAVRYGRGSVDEARRESGAITDEDLESFVEDLQRCDDGGRELYRQAVLDAGLPRACEVRTALADFFGLEVPREWTPELLEQSLASFGGLERAGAGPLTEEEFVLWPVGAVQLQKLEEQQRRRLAAQLPAKSVTETSSSGSPSASPGTPRPLGQSATAADGEDTSATPGEEAPSRSAFAW